MTGSADGDKTRSVSEAESTKPSPSEPEPSANGPKRSENFPNNEIQDSSELLNDHSSQEINQDSMLTDTDISEQVNSVKQRLKDCTDGYGIPQLERLYSRVLKGVMAIRSREGCKDHKLLILRHLLKFVEEDDNF